MHTGLKHLVALNQTQPVLPGYEQDKALNYKKLSFISEPLTLLNYLTLLSLCHHVSSGVAVIFSVQDS